MANFGEIHIMIVNTSTSSSAGIFKVKRRGGVEPSEAYCAELRRIEDSVSESAVFRLAVI